MSLNGSVDTFEFVSQLRRKGIRISAENGQLKLSAPKNTLTPALKQELAARKADILTLFESVNGQVSSKLPAIDSVNQAGLLPLSYAQERLWFFEQLQPGQIAYHMPMGLRLRGRIDGVILQKSINTLVQRHPALRTTFVDRGGNPLQQIHPQMHIPLETLELSQYPLAERADWGRKLTREFISKPFDLKEGPLVRALTLCMGDNEQLLLLSLHHIVADGWSLGLISDELLQIYAALSQNKRPNLPELSLQFVDYAHWEKTQFEDPAVLKPHVDYWKDELAGAPQRLDLPVAQQRTDTLNLEGTVLPFEISAELTAQLKNLSQREGASLYMTLLSAFYTLLYRYTRSTDLVVGSPIANRNRTELEGIIGYFTNTLALRANIDPKQSFADLLREVRLTVLKGFDHQALPFDKLVEQLQPERNLGYNPIYQVLFALQNNRVVAPDLNGVEAEFVNIHTDSSKLDLFFEMWESGDSIEGRVEFSTALFDAETVAQLINHYQQLLRSIVADVTVPVGRLELMDSAEKVQILQSFNATTTSTPDFPVVHQAFEAQVAKTPTMVALDMLGTTVTYAELNARANQLANYLQKQGVKPNTLVGVYLPRSIDMIISVLAILKAGGAYLPLDPIYPVERRAYMLRNADAPLLLTHAKLAADMPPSSTKHILLDEDWGLISAESNENPTSSVQGNDLIYAIYTSGSTGQPKGVGLPHRAIANLIAWQHKQTHHLQGARTAQFTSLSFDVSCQEIFTALTSGGTLVLVPETTRSNMVSMANFLAREEIDRLFLPFIALQQIAEAVGADPTLKLSLKEVITAGEQLQVTDALIAMFERTPSAMLVNQYGPTEAHVVTAFELSGSPKAWPLLPSIGKPIDNVQMYILDEVMQPVPVGVPGMLYIGGVNVAKGYLNAEALSAERFIPHPDHLLPAQPTHDTLYNTGDLARYDRHGNIDYLGRADRQVKIRGYRLELNEIEAALAGHPTIHETAVSLHEFAADDKRLVAYVVGHGVPAPEVLRDFLAKTLPEYMLPSFYVTLPQLPLTPSGKVDRKSLPTPSPAAVSRSETYTAPRDALEYKLTELWERILKVEKIGIHDNFFEMGGHSLMALRLFSNIEQMTGQKLPLSVLFQAPTIAKLSAIMQNEGWQPAWSSIVPINPSGFKRPFFYVSPYLISVLNFTDLSKHLDDDRPFYGIQPQGLDDETKIHTTIPMMAAHYIKEMKMLQPKGPYVLGGHCAGAWVAFEMTRQLEAQGDAVQFLAIVDILPPNHQEEEKGMLSYYSNRAAYYIRDRRLMHALAWKVRMQFESRMLHRFGTEQSQRAMLVREAHDEAFDNYSAESNIKAPMNLFCSSENMTLQKDGWHQQWGELTDGSFQYDVVEGTHAIMLREPYAGNLGRELQKRIDQRVKD